MALMQCILQANTCIQMTWLQLIGAKISQQSILPSIALLTSEQFLNFRAISLVPLLRILVMQFQVLINRFIWTMSTKMQVMYL